MPSGGKLKTGGIEMAFLRQLVCSFALLTAGGLLASAPAHAACATVLQVQLETFGEGVSVELRRGTPGSSRVVATQQSHGGTVYFRNLCAGTYFMAIGNGDDVEVTPVHDFQDYHQYQSKITMQRGAGNVARKKRGAL
jgi:hypothetical protein